MTGFPFAALNAQHARALSQMDRAEQAAAERAVNEAEAASWRLVARAENYRTAMEIARMEADRRDDSAQRHADEEAAQRAAELEDYRCMAMAAGARPRTVQEILSAAAGLPSLLPNPAAPDGGTVPTVAQRAELLIDYEPLTPYQPPRVAGEDAGLLERCAQERAAWDSATMVAVRSASARRQAAQPPLWLRHRDAAPEPYDPAPEVTRQAGQPEQDDLFRDPGWPAPLRCNDPRCCPPGQ